MLTKEICNDFLLKNYGRSKGTEYPRYRIVFSDDQLEKRLVEKPGDDTKLLPEKELRILPKYPFTRGRYIFEFHFPTDNPELIDHAGNYEPLYVFEDWRGESLPLDLEIIQMICHGLQQHVVKKNAKMLQDEYNKKMEKEAAREFEILDNNSPYIATMLNNKEAVFLDSKKVMITDAEP